MGFWSSVGEVAVDMVKKLPDALAKRDANLGGSIEKLGDSATDRQKEILVEINTRHANREERLVRQMEREARQTERRAKQEEERKAREEIENN